MILYNIVSDVRICHNIVVISLQNVCVTHYHGKLLNLKYQWTYNMLKVLPEKKSWNDDTTITTHKK